MPPLIFIPVYILILLFYITSIGYVLVDSCLGSLAQSIEITIPFQSIILIISMLGPCVTLIVCGYRFNNVQVSNGLEKEEWAVNLESACKIFAQTARFPFDMRHPKHTEKIARHVQKDFAEYLANPYAYSLWVSLFSRRLQYFAIVVISLTAVCLACIPFKEWSKYDHTLTKSGEAFIQALGCPLVVLWCYFFWEPMWIVGWALKMGGIARRIRRDCIKNGSVKGSEGDVEKSGISIDPEKELEWWVRESWKACEDGHDIHCSELSQA